jgi:tetratricopeptide (TPR) repeat protein
VFSWIIRAVVAVVCGLIIARSIRIAVADVRAQKGPAGLDRALSLEPRDSVLLARAALARDSGGDMSRAADLQLLRASEADPFNADLLIALGLREEFRGHNGEAERYLMHAAEIDHTFKPAWTLANYYFRRNQPDKMWPVIRRSLELNPLTFDLRPVFDLCWNGGGDPASIANLMPARGTVPLQYLSYLMGRNRIDAAIAFWPRALKTADPANPVYVDVLTGYTESLQQANRISDSVRGWNDLVDRKIVISGRLDPAAGVSVADPDLSFPLVERGFGWRLAHEAGVAVAKGPAGLRFEFDGNQPESSTLLSAATALVPGREYRLVWKTDASRLSSPRDAGFVWQIAQQPGNTVTVCQPALQAGDDGACRFRGVPGSGNARIDLLYKRALGTTRVDGILRVTLVRLEFTS